ncbi:MAG: winged helix-turn-helix domain-containing protein [Patescibacteria group bacterium]
MLEHLFGSRTRVKLLRLFSSNPDKSYYVRELTRKLGEQINSIRRELANLENIGFLTSKASNKKKYYSVVTDYILFPELKSLILKSRFTLERKFISNISSFGTIKYLALSGYFVEDPHAPVDLFIVGKISRKKMSELLGKFNKDTGEEIRYTVMDEKEYKYRKDITDKFLYEILNGKKVMVIDKLNK